MDAFVTRRPRAEQPAAVDPASHGKTTAADDGNKRSQSENNEPGDRCGGVTPQPSNLEVKAKRRRLELSSTSPEPGLTKHDSSEDVAESMSVPASDMSGPDIKKPSCRYNDQLISYSQSKRNIDSCNIESTVPEICKSQECWLGIDEAGRGPVCGPMTYGTAFGPIMGDTHSKGRLKAMGFADSKQLTEVQREKLFKDIKSATDYLGWIVTILSPADISQAMLGRVNYNLNALSHDTAIQLIRRVLALGVNLTEIYVDTVGKEEFYQSKLQQLFPQLKVTVTSKADDKFPICSAASICAKVSRDRIIERWRYPEDLPGLSLEVGSGYPGDPDCKKWLNAAVDYIFGYPSLVRFSWSTTRKILEERCAPVSWEDDEEESDTPSVMTFFGKKKEGPPRHRFFKNARLKHVSEF